MAMLGAAYIVGIFPPRRQRRRANRRRIACESDDDETLVRDSAIRQRILSLAAARWNTGFPVCKSSQTAAIFDVPIARGG